MRFAALNLMAYGHFTDRRLVLAPGATDLHIVFGANEAGKSTARSAIGDFLFGFNTRTSLNFLHANPALRIGAQIQTPDSCIDAIRRKGNKHTLLDIEGNAATELDNELQRQLAGAERSFFTRMFSLDHDALRDGGTALAAAGANAETTLLSAGSGLADVLTQRQALADEAGSLWAPNRSKDRRYYQAEDRYKTADDAIRTFEVTVGDWQRSRSALDAAEAHYNSLREQRRALDHQWRELERIRRVAQPVRRLQDIDQALTTLGDVPALADSARQLFDDARQQIDTAERGMATITQQIDAIDAELAELTDKPLLLEQAHAIEQLNEQRAGLAEDRERVARLEDDAAQLAQALADHRTELGWQQTATDWPGGADIRAARTLAERYPTLAQQATHAAADLQKLEDSTQRLAAKAAQTGTQRDTRALSAWYAACIREGNLEADHRSATVRVATADRDIQRRLAVLDPPVADIQTLHQLAQNSLPRADQITDMSRAMTDADDALQRRQQRVDELADELSQARAAYERRRSDDQLPSADTLAATRHEREQCWQLVRQRYIEQRCPDLFDEPDTLAPHIRKDPAPALEQLTQQADELADARFAHSHAIAEEAERARHIADREQALTQARQRCEKAQAYVEQLAREWTQAWADAVSLASAFEPYTPAAMQDWLGRCNVLLDASAEREEALAQQQELAQRIQTHRETGIQQLSALGYSADELADVRLAELLEHARQLIDTEQRDRQDRVQLAADQDALQAERTAQKTEHDRAEQAMADWQQAWLQALEPLGLSKDTTVEDARAVLTTLESARALDAQRTDCIAERKRLSARDDRFVDALADVLTATGIQTQAHERPEQVVLSLYGALRSAQEAQQTRELRNSDYRRARAQIAAHQDARRKAEQAIAALADKAGITDLSTLDALAAVIERAEQQRRLQTERVQAVAALTEHGDGKPIAQLSDAVDATDLASLREQIHELTEEMEDLDPLLNTARDERNAARAVFEAIGGDERAVVAATERQTALSDMTDAAEQYLRVGIAALLLKWAGQRYAMDKQRPMIERGSALMNQLTGGSVARLIGEFDDAGELQIVGMRADASRVAPTGMSEGTRDQLYLALRMAAIEDYLDHAAPLPVVADDLFINFDDERALAGLNVLAGLAERTQVLFFTHHQHLRDMAVERLGKRVTAHDL